MKSINKKASRHGGKEMTTKEIKELGAQAEKEAVTMFEAKTKKKKSIEQQTPPPANEQVQPIVPAVSDQWSPVLEPGWSIMQMGMDGNCFYRAVSDQLFHDEGAGHVIVRHQVNNYIRRNGEEFKNFLLLSDGNVEVTDIGEYISRMGKDGAWAGHPEIYAAAWCYKVDITIYSKDYSAMGGSLVFKSVGTTE